MTWMDRLEKKMGRYAIPNITRVFIVANLLGAVLYMVFKEYAIYLFTFDGAAILHGQFYRLFTWILYPTGGLSFFSLLFIFCLWMLGDSLERYLGSFRMNLYFFGGIILNIVVGMLVYVIFHISISLSMYHILFSLYLMLGLFMPEAEVRLYFVLPIRMKWLTILYFVMLAYDVYSYFRMGVGYGIKYGSEIVLAVVNLLFFVYSCKNRLSRKQKRKQREFRAEFKAAEPRPGSGITRHKCAICGRTELDDPNLQFRFCSKCEGNFEYCQEHLFTHRHVKNS